MARREMYKCPVCGRCHIKDYMTLHHLHPTITNVEKGQKTIYICHTCHDVIHFCHTNEDLRFNFDTLELILSSKKIQNMIQLYKYKADNCVFRIKRLKALYEVA